jgi:hypothetical protein
MEATTENLSMLSELLTQSLSPQPEIRHPAEKNLNSTELQPGFLLLVLTLVKDDRAALDIRQAAGVYFKNVVRKRWGEVRPIRAKLSLVSVLISRAGNGTLGIRQDGGQVTAGTDHGQLVDTWWTGGEAAVTDRRSGSRDRERGFPGTLAESARCK